MKKLALIVLYSVLAALLATGCATTTPTTPTTTATTTTTPKPVPVEPPRISQARQVKALLDLGRERLAGGDYDGAADAFNAVLAKDPLRRDSAQAMFGLAQADLGAKRQAQALTWLDRLLEKTPDWPKAPQASLLAAKLERSLNQNEAAAQRLQRLLSQPPISMSRADRIEARELLADLLAENGRYLEAVRTMVALARDSDPEKAIELSERLATLAGRSAPPQVERILAGTHDPRIRAALLAGLARAHLNQGDLEAAQNQIRRLREAPLSERWQGLSEELESEISQAKVVNPRAVGVILPLSGAYRAHGRQVLAAVELGLDLFKPMSYGAAGAPTLFIEDSKSDPAAAADAVNRLVEQRRVIAIIGPMGAAPSLAAARRAQQLEVPMISLSQVDGITQAGDFIFQNFTSPAQQVTAVLDEVINNLGAKRLAILAPRMAYGQGFARLFEQETAIRGVPVARTIYYDPAKTDFTAEIKALVHLPAGNYRPGRPDSPKPKIDFDALFIPDGPERAGMLASQLAYFDVVGIYLMGTSLWHDPRLLEAGGGYFRMSFFPASFDPESKNPLSAGFVRGFSRAVGKIPNLLDAHGYDAALIIRRLMDQYNAPRTRRGFKQALSALSGVAGVCGAMSVGAERRIVRPLTLYTIRRDAFVPLSETLPQHMRESPAAAERPQGSPLRPPPPAPAGTILR